MPGSPAFATEHARNRPLARTFGKRVEKFAEAALTRSAGCAPVPLGSALKSEARPRHLASSTLYVGKSCLFRPISARKGKFRGGDSLQSSRVPSIVVRE